MDSPLDGPRDPGMRFFLPTTVDEAVDLLGVAAGYVCVAGGGLIVPSLRSGARPAGLVSLRRVGVIRNMTTIGGTVCRADPSADYSAALLAAGATIHLRAKDGERSVAIDDFVLGDNKTARRADELVTSVSLPRDLGRGSGAYIRFSRVDGDSPVVTVAVRLEWRDGVVRSARIAVGGCGPKAFRPGEAESLVCGRARVEEIPAALFDSAVAEARPVSDIKGSADHRRRLIPGLLRRALAQGFAAGAS